LGSSSSPSSSSSSSNGCSPDPSVNVTVTGGSYPFTICGLTFTASGQTKPLCPTSYTKTATTFNNTEGWAHATPSINHAIGVFVKSYYSTFVGFFAGTNGWRIQTGVTATTPTGTNTTPFGESVYAKYNKYGTPVTVSFERGTATAWSPGVATVKALWGTGVIPDAMFGTVTLSSGGHTIVTSRGVGW
jgi:hypothetical protein